MKGVHTKIGDVFAAPLGDGTKRYFQLIAYDLTQLNSDVIRAFKEAYSIDHSPKVSDIVNGEVAFYAHCVTKGGVKMNLWEKVGSIADTGPTNQILFRDTNDYGCKLGEEPVRVSDSWYVWHINDENFTRVGKLEGENRKAFIGLVINPISILEMLRGNMYPFQYPHYE